jgi:hypothetical protein
MFPAIEKDVLRECRLVGGRQAPLPAKYRNRGTAGCPKGAEVDRAAPGAA